MSKYFRLDEALGEGAVIALDAHRFVKVLRLQAGDTITVCGPDEVLHTAVITRVSPQVLAAIGPRLTAAEAPDRNAKAPLEAWLPLLKGGKTDDLVRHATELGATRLVPFASKHAVVRLDGKRAAERRERFAAIAREAGNQCGRTDLPEVAVPVSGLPTVGPGVFLWEGGGEPALATLQARPELAARVLTGPEGGFALAEADALIALGWVPLTLGHRILKADTAALVMLALAQAARAAF